MSHKVLIVEDQFVEANNLQLMLEKAGYSVCGISRTVEDAIRVIEQEQPDLALVDIQLKGPLTGIELASVLREKNIAFIYVSANSNRETLIRAKATQPYGFIVKPFRERDLMVTLEIAQYRHENSLETAVMKEEQLRLRLQQIMHNKDSWDDKMLNIAKALQTFLSFDYLASCTNKGSKAGKLMSFLRVGYDEYQSIGLEEFQVITNLKMSELYKLQPKDDFEQTRAFYAGEDFLRLTESQGLIKLIAETFSLHSLSLLPIVLPDGTHFNFGFYSRRKDAYNAEQVTLLNRLTNPLSIAIKTMLELDSMSTIPKESNVAKEKPNHEKAITTGFEDVIGKSHLLLRVFDSIAQVAPVDTSVLILGESGTGKEKIAQIIHDQSRRKGRPMVKLNCATLPSNLIESELFGHEKGAFTGAVDKRIGKFERAEKGTIFLDEIGDMPLELQAKLLRVLQEKEIERIGGNSTIKVDVRILAATNRDLEKEVAAGRFRLDLYYRLNIFPIILPPLRDRKEDIPALINHFIVEANKKTGKRIIGISAQGLKEAVLYNWPGNIRELENLVERAVLTSQEPELKRLEISYLQQQEEVGETTNNNSFKTIDENEREHIIKALRQCKGKIWGEGGAAELLNLPPSTLNSKMKNFGIKRDFF